MFVVPVMTNNYVTVVNNIHRVRVASDITAPRCWSRRCCCLLSSCKTVLITIFLIILRLFSPLPLPEQHKKNATWMMLDKQILHCYQVHAMRGSCLFVVFSFHFVLLLFWNQPRINDSIILHLIPVDGWVDTISTGQWWMDCAIWWFANVYVVSALSSLFFGKILDFF